jgi:hypothetical protein
MRQGKHFDFDELRQVTSTTTGSEPQRAPKHDPTEGSTPRNQYGSRRGKEERSESRKQTPRFLPVHRGVFAVISGSGSCPPISRAWKRSSSIEPGRLAWVRAGPAGSPGHAPRHQVRTRCRVPSARCP